jgi:heptosyltransferase-2
VDDVFAVDLRAAYAGTPAARLRAFARAARELRRWRPDTAATLKAATPWAALAAASGARRRVGLARGRVAGALLTAPIDPPADRHHEDRYADVARAVGADPAAGAAPAWPDALPPAAARLFASAAPVLAVAPGGARNVKQDMPVKRWPADRWAAVVARLARERPDLRVVMLGGAGDRAEADVVGAAVPPDRLCDLAGRTSVAEARAVLGAASACLVHDSGLLHLAATTAAEVVAVFGPTDPGVLCPRRAGVAALWSPARGAACQDGRTGAVRGCVTPCCMERVNVDAVAAAVREALDRASRRPRAASREPGSLVGR